MIKIKILLFLIVVIIFNRIGVAAHAADSGVSLGVTVISVGPPTINDFDYSAFNTSIPKMNLGLTKDANTDPAGDQAELTSESGSDGIKNVNQNNNKNVTATNLSAESVTDSQLNETTGPEENQGLVKGTKSSAHTSWFRNFLDECIIFLERIIQTRYWPEIQNT